MATTTTTTTKLQCFILYEMIPHRVTHIHTINVPGIVAGQDVMKCT